MNVLPLHIFIYYLYLFILFIFLFINIYIFSAYHMYFVISVVSIALIKTGR